MKQDAKRGVQKLLQMAFQSKDGNFRTTWQKSNGILKPNKTSRTTSCTISSVNKSCKTPYLHLFPFCTRRYAIFRDITRLNCTFSWKKPDGWLDWIIPSKQTIFLLRVVQTFSVIYNKVAFLIWVEIWMTREVCVQNKLLYLMCLQGQ